MNQSVVVISAVSPFPVDTGRRVFLAGLVQYLVDRFGGDAVHYGLAAPAVIPTPHLPCRVHRLPVPSTREKMSNAVVHSMLQRRWSMQESMLSTPRLRSAVAALMHTYSPALEIYDTVRMAQHRAPARPDSTSMVHLDDLYSGRYERMVDSPAAAEPDFNPLGEFATNIPAPLRRAAGNPRVYRRLLRWEAQRMRQRECEVARDFPCATLVNAQEVSALRQQTGLSTIRVITPLLATPRPVPRSPVDPPEFVFLGRLNLPHNNDAICSFIEGAWPLLLQRSPKCQLRVVGKSASPTLRRLAAAHSGSIRLEGFVDDLDSLLARAVAVIAPLRFGSGIKQKILDAVARGVPVVGTEVAFEGIPARRSPLATAPAGAAYSDGCIIAEDPGSWPGPLLQLTDVDVNAAYSAAARDFFQRTYSAEVVYSQYDEIFNPGGESGRALKTTHVA